MESEFHAFCFLICLQFWLMETFVLSSQQFSPSSEFFPCVDVLQTKCPSEGRLEPWDDVDGDDNSDEKYGDDDNDEKDDDDVDEKSPVDAGLPGVLLGQL